MLALHSNIVARRNTREKNNNTLHLATNIIPFESKLTHLQQMGNPNTSTEYDSKLGPLPANNECVNVPNTPPADAMLMIQQALAGLSCRVEGLSCRVEGLEGKVDDLELDIKSTITCRVCYKNVPIEGVSHVNVLGCGHAFCNVCALSMKRCAMCNAAVVGKFKLFI